MAATGWWMHACALVRRSMVWIVWTAGAAATAHAAPPPAGDFFKPDAYADVRLAPSGTRVAATVPASNGRRALAVIDIADASKTKVIVAYGDADIFDVEWVSDSRLVYRLRDEQHALGKQRPRGLFAIDADGKESPRMLIQPGWFFKGAQTGSNIAQRALQPDSYLYRVLRDGSDDVLVGQAVFDNVGDVSNINLSRLSTVDGTVRNISGGAPPHVRGWVTDEQGRPRFVTTVDQGITKLFWKANDDTRWVQVDEGDTYTEGVLRPMRIDAYNKVFVRARVAPESDVVSLATLEIAADGRKKIEPLLTTPGFDFEGNLVITRSGKVLGVRYKTEAAATYWFDPAMKKFQEQVDKLRPSTNNLLYCGHCENIRNVLVLSYSDRLPSAYSVFDTTSGKLEPLAASRPWIKPQEMAGTDMVRVPMRDGLVAPIYVTRPNGQKAPAPTVVLVHGGPYLRGAEWEWRAEAQFLASRGYVVVEPEFRGSKGYGYKHFAAGLKQWGLAMQDDVADAAKWAIKQGYADPKRVCVVGASYGGYATLMGLIRDPEIFRCGVEFAGVTDINLMYSIAWSDADEQYKTYGMPRLIGDRTKDAAQLAATSPILLASKITRPLLMVHGSIDQRVPIDHGGRLYDEVRKTNPNVEWKVYADEGHGFHLPANEIDFWGRVETFLDKNLKNAPM